MPQVSQVPLSRSEFRARVPKGGAAEQSVRRTMRHLADVFEHLAREEVEEIVESVANSVVRTDLSPTAMSQVARLGMQITGGSSVTKDEAARLEAQTQVRFAALRQARMADALSTKEVAALLGTSRQTPHDRRKARSLVGILDKGQWWFPRWQFNASGPNGVLAGLPTVAQAIKGGDWERANWFVRPNVYLENRTPVQALRDVDVERVLDAARLTGPA